MIALLSATGLRIAEALKLTVAGMTGSDAIDFADISFASVQTPDFTGSAFDGRLTVSDGVHTDHVTLLGDYLASSFAVSSDGQGGTLVIDPPRQGATTG